MSEHDPAPSDERPDPRVVSADRRAPLRIDRAVVDDIAAYVSDDTSVERGGVLVGTVDDEGFVVIDASIRAIDAVSRPSSLTFTHETWAAINQELERDHAGKRIVGWYHSHPGFSVFLSEYDTFIHENFFSAPWQVAYVVDPLVGDDGFFGWHDGQIVRYSEWEVRAVAGHAGAAVAAPARHRDVSPDQLSSPVGGPRRLVTFGVGAVAAALVGVLVGLTLAPDRSSDSDVVAHRPVVRRDGLVVAGELTVRDGCLHVRRDVVNPSDDPHPSFVFVDPLPDVLHGASTCVGGEQIDSPFTISVPNQVAGASTARISYALRLPDGIDGDRASLRALARQFRSAWRALQAEPVGLEVDDVTVEVGAEVPLEVRRRAPDGSLLEPEIPESWSVEPADVADLGEDGVRGLVAGTAALVGVDGGDLASIEVVEPG